MSILIHRQIHGYRSGHQLLHSTVNLDRNDQEIIDNLSDMAGPLRPGELFLPYLCAYPTPSQQFFVLSRTDQDLDAPRAGCVITRTLLVPTDYWAEQADPVYLGEILWRVWDEHPLEISGAERAPSPPAVPSNSLLPLVEALFLEHRNPIVLFGATQSKEIALRLLSALWPSMRRAFSLCTFALSPRFVQGKPFDLVFAPADAKSRFSDWKGRRIDIGSRPSEARHRWTKEVADKIFTAARPSLLIDDSIGALAADATGDEGALRLTLLWDELLQQVAVSPGAAIGLLDIARSRGIEPVTWPIVEPSIVKALQITPAAANPTDAWPLISALIGKLLPRQLTPNVVNALARSTYQLADKDWKAALTYVAQVPHSGVGDRVVLRAISASISKVTSTELEESLSILPESRLLQMLLMDEALRTRVLTNDTTILTMVSRAIGQTTTDERRNATSALLPFVTSDRSLELLAALLKDASASVVQTIASHVWSIESARTPTIGDELCRAAATTHAEASVRDVFAAHGIDEVSKACIRRLIATTPDDIGWILRTNSLHGARSDLLEHLERQAGLSQLTAAINASSFGPSVISILVDEGNYGLAARLAPLVIPKIPNLLAFFTDAYGRLPSPDREAFAEAIFCHVVRQASPEDTFAMIQIVELLSAHQPPATLLSWIGTLLLDNEHLSNVYVALGSLPSSLKERFACEPWLLSKPIIDQNQINLSNDAIAAISDLLALSETYNPSVFNVCSWRLLPLAMEARDRFASPLLLVVFPTVYDNLRRSTTLGGVFGGWIFSDWDKCKTARKRLVRSFMISIWPPSDLARIAAKVHDLDRIFLRTLKEPGGTSYLQRVEDDLHSFPEDIRAQVGSALKSARSWGSYISDVDT